MNGAQTKMSSVTSDFVMRPGGYANWQVRPLPPGRTHSTPPHAFLTAARLGIPSPAVTW